MSRSGSISSSSESLSFEGNTESRKKNNMDLVTLKPSQKKETSSQLQFENITIICEKVSQFLKVQNISAQSWLKFGEEIEKDRDVWKILNQLGLPISENEVTLLLNEYQNKYPFSSMELYFKLKYFDGQDPEIQNNIKPQKSQKDIRIRPLTAGSSRNIPARYTQPLMDVQDLDKDLEGLFHRELNLIGKDSADYNFRKFMIENQRKNQQNEKSINLAVDKYRKEFEYECLNKMGEANEIAHQLCSPYTFRAVKDNDGTTKCHVYKGEKFFREITLEGFLREYRRLKRNFNFDQTHKQQIKPPTAKKINKKERQQELKLVLQRTIQLTDKLREQLSILQRQGVTPNKKTHLEEYL